MKPFLMKAMICAFASEKEITSSISTYIETVLKQLMHLIKLWTIKTYYNTLLKRRMIVGNKFACNI